MRYRDIKPMKRLHPMHADDFGSWEASLEFHKQLSRGYPLIDRWQYIYNRNGVHVSLIRFVNYFMPGDNFWAWWSAYDCVERRYTTKKEAEKAIFRFYLDLEKRVKGGAPRDEGS